jgi:hypothetical protein
MLATLGWAVLVTISVFCLVGAVVVLFAPAGVLDRVRAPGSGSAGIGGNGGSGDGAGGSSGEGAGGGGGSDW